MRKRKGDASPITRLDIPPDGRPAPANRTRRILAGLTAAVLSAITGVISYSHGLTVVRLVGNTGIVAYLVPLVPDLMIVTSSLTLIEASAVRAPRPPMAMAALLAGIGWTVAMNVGAGVRNGPGGAVLDAGIPLAFVLTFESLLWLFRRGRGGASLAPVPATSIHADPPTTDEALRVLLATGSQRVLAEDLGVTKARVQTWAARLAMPPGVAAETIPEPSLNGSAGGAS